MQLNFDTLFNILVLVAVKIQNNAIVKKEEDREIHEILITTTELAIPGVDDDVFNDFLWFLLHKDKADHKVFDAECFIRKKKEDPDLEDFYAMEDDFIDKEYRLVVEKSVSVLLQDMFYNLKSMFYESEKHEIFFKFLNESVEKQCLPILKNHLGYKLNEDVFTANEQQIYIVCSDLFRRNINTKSTINNNSEKYLTGIKTTKIDKIKELDKGNKAIKDKKEGGKETSSGTVGYQIKSLVVKQMYFRERTRSIVKEYKIDDYIVEPTTNNHKIAINIHEALGLLAKVCRIYERKELKFEWEAIDEIKKFIEKRNIAKQVLSTDKWLLNPGNVFQDFFDWFSDYYSINKDNVAKWISTYLKNYLAKPRLNQIYKWCIEFDNEEYSSDSGKSKNKKPKQKAKKSN